VVFPAFALLAVTAGFASASFRLRGLAATLLAAYLFAAAEIVALTLALSPFRAVSAPGYLVGELVVAVLVLSAWHRLGKPVPNWPSVDLRMLKQHPLLVALGLVVGLTLLFQLFLVIVAPPNNWDSMTYHLARAASWYQHRSIGYVAGANTERLNIFPPNAEIATLYTFAFVHSDRLAALPQYLAGLASLCGCYAISRRVGFSRSSSLFATLILASLSQVVLQATTTQNDLIVASFVVAGAVFVLDGGRRGLGLAGVAVGLAVGTKTTALFALPLLAVLAVATLRRRQILELAASSAAGALCFGSFAYVENVVHRHSLLGAGSEQNAFRSDVTLAGIAGRLGDIFARFLDLSGFRPILGSGTGFAALAAILVAVPPALWALDRRIGRRREREPDARLLLGLAPVAVIALGALEPEVGIHVGVNLRANEDFAFFGALGAALVLPAALATLVASTRRKPDLRRCALAAAIPLFALELAAAYEYNEWIGRFMIIPVALTVPLVAAAYPARKLAAASVVLAAVGCFAAVAFNEGKPTGLAGTTPVWEMSRARAEALSRPRMEPIIGLVQTTVPQGVRLGVVAGHDDWSYPFYGRSLERKIVYLDEGDALAAARRQGIGEVLFARGKRPAAMPEGWRVITDSRSGWILAREPRRVQAVASVG
jgi:dolichyl-phosphate-mannose-protein mannosyltransferase